MSKANNSFENKTLSLFCNNQPMKHFLFLPLMFCLFSQFLFGQAGEIDTTFNYEMYDTYLDGSGFNNKVLSSAIQSDGKIIVGGLFSAINGVQIGRLARLNPNGSLDQSFNPGNLFTSSDQNYVSDIYIRADGKIIVCGNFVYNNGFGGTTVVLLNSDGSVDGSFALEYASNLITRMAIQPDGKIILGGLDGTVISNGITRKIPCRIDQNGVLDPTFNSGTGINDYGQIFSIDVSSNGKIALGGYFTSCNGTQSINIVQLNNDGSVDNSFTTVSNMNYWVNSVFYQSDEKLIIGGSFSTINNVSTPVIARFNLDGTIDNSFQCSPVGSVTKIKEISNDTLIIAFGGSLFKIKPDGTTISGNTLSYDNDINDIEISDDNQFFIFGSFTYIGTSWDNSVYKNISAKLNEDLTVFPNYSLKTGSDGVLFNAIEDNHGKILVSGQLHSYNNSYTDGVVRLNQDGTKDSTFFIAQNLGIGNIKVVCNQFDDKLIIGGYFSGNLDNVPTNLARLNYNGTIDTSFHIGSGLDNFVESIVCQPDGKIIVGGDFLSLNGSTTKRIVRLNNDGSIDNTFDTGNGFDGRVRSIEFSSTGKIYVVGDFQTYNGTPSNYLIRLNPNGTIDTSFNIGSGFNNSTFNVKELSNGDLLVSGNFTVYNNNSVRAIIKLHPDGTIANDIVFTQIENHPNNYVSDFIEQPDGKLVLSGYFLLPDLSFMNILRLNSTGSIDSTFITHTVNIGSIGDLLFQINGKIIAVGNFLKVDNVVQNYLSRFNNDIQGYSNLALGFQNIQYPGCSGSGAISVEGSGGIPPYSYLWNTTGDSTSSTQQISNPGLYFCTISDVTGYQVTQPIYLYGAVDSSQTDLKVNVISESFRPGFETILYLDALNDGCLNVSGTASIILDSLVEFVFSNPSPSLINGDTLSFDFDSLYFNSEHFIPQLTVLTSTVAQIGDSIKLTAFINPILNDSNPNNNHKLYIFPVINGYDPNYKDVYPKGKCEENYIESNQELTYTIHFQNTGNSEAINILVSDTLDEDLDISSFRIVGKSHNVYASINNQVVTFHFDSIMLPDSSSNNIGSNGYVVFEISPLPELETGINISNQVGIYFDFNPPIITNQVFNTIYDGEIDSLDCSQIVSIADESSSFLETIFVFPNPFENELSIKIPKSILNKKIQLFDSRGVQQLESIVELEETKFELPFLAPGIYLLKIDEVTLKVVKN